MRTVREIVEEIKTMPESEMSAITEEIDVYLKDLYYVRNGVE
jgi:hypothetical protein